MLPVIKENLENMLKLKHSSCVETGQNRAHILRPMKLRVLHGNPELARKPGACKETRSLPGKPGVSEDLCRQKSSQFDL